MSALVLAGTPTIFAPPELKHVMLAAAIQAFQELFTPPFRAVLFKCVGFTIGLLALLIIVLEWPVQSFRPNGRTGSRPPSNGWAASRSWSARSSSSRR